MAAGYSGGPESLARQRIRPNVSPDAVVVVPGIMGSALESASGVLWGGHNLGWYAGAWMNKVRIAPGNRSPLDELALTDDERNGHYGRIRATSLLRKPAWAPFLRGLEPYGDLIKGIDKDVVVHRDAIRAFPYDWRLPVAYNATLLERCIREHLAAWLVHPEYQRFRRRLPDTRPAQVVVVAHSMGGLLARSLPGDIDIRATVTLGTPFNGSAMAPLVLNTGRGGPVPLPREQLRRMAVTLPGLHDLLPTYRCLDDAVHDTDPTRMTPDLVAAIGGDRDLASASFSWQERIATGRLPGHRRVVGIEQPTTSTVTIEDGVLTGHDYSFQTTHDGFARDEHGVLIRRLRHGDGTVPYNSALPTRADYIPLAQQHGALAMVKESIDLVRTVLREDDEDGEALGDGDLGMELPDIATLGDDVTLTIRGLTGSADATVFVFDEQGLPIDHPAVHFADGDYRARFEPPEEGIYQVVVDGHGTTALSQRLLVIEPT